MSRHPDAQAGHAACWRAHPPEVAPGVPMRLSMLTRVALVVNRPDATPTVHLPPGAIIYDETTSAVGDCLHLHLQGLADGSDLRFGVAALLGLDPRRPCASVEFAVDQWIDNNVVMVAMPEATISVDHPTSGAFNGLRYAWSQPGRRSDEAQQEKE